jgi:hypothetical protein
VATDGQLDLVEIYKSKATAKEKQTKNTLVIFVEMQQVRCLSSLSWLCSEFILCAWACLVVWECERACVGKEGDWEEFEPHRR